MNGSLTNYKVDTTEEMDKKTREFKRQGYSVAVFGEKVRILGKLGHTIVITFAKENK